MKSKSDKDILDTILYIDCESMIIILIHWLFMSVFFKVHET
jgi:hypothetical protein